MTGEEQVKKTNIEEERETGGEKEDGKGYYFSVIPITEWKDFHLYPKERGTCQFAFYREKKGKINFARTEVRKFWKR